MDVLFLANQLLEGIVNQIKKTENIEQRSGGQAMPEIQDLKCDLIKHKEIAQQMIEEINDSVKLNPEEIKKLEEKIRKLENKIKKLEEKIAEQDEQIAKFQTQLEATQNELKEKEIALQTGQIAFEFEKDLATYIYPEGKRIGSRKIFTNMKEWLEKKKDTPQGREAKAKWEDLQEEFSWSDKHEKVFHELLKFRREFAHPPVDRDAVQSQIPNAFNDEEKKCIKDIIDIIDRVNELMK